MFNQVLAGSPTKRSARRLYDEAARQSRSEAFYTRMGVADTVEGRFEMLTLHMILLIDRLKTESAEIQDFRQTLFDVYVSNLDGALREMGVGDLAVGKRMRKLGEAFYGRARAYDFAFEALPDISVLEETLGRIVLQNAPGTLVRSLADYVARCRDVLAASEVRALTSGAPPWATP
jgi:cytochrome b pre-mRNA-processing protein 3